MVLLPVEAPGETLTLVSALTGEPVEFVTTFDEIPSVLDCLETMLPDEPVIVGVSRIVELLLGLVVG